LAALDQRAAGVKAALEKARDDLRRNEADRRKLELDVQAKQQLVGRYKSQQLQTRKNEEYSALMHEIEREEGAIAAIEDQELVLMEAQEKLQSVLKSAQASLDSTLAAIAKDKETVQNRLDQAKKSLVEAEALRAEADGKVEEVLLLLYRRILASKKDSAIAQLANGICGGCHMRVTSQTANRAEHGEAIVQCDNCGRILYCA
jgi:hypothetical protein